MSLAIRQLRSCLRLRDMSRSTSSAGVRCPSITEVTAAAIGMSTSLVPSRARAPSDTTSHPRRSAGSRRPPPRRSGPCRGSRRTCDCATSGDMHVAMRSPTPARPRKVLRVGAEPDAQASHLGKSTRDDRGFGVVPHPHALCHANRQGDDVLDRSTELGADDVGVGVWPEVGRSRTPRLPGRPMSWSRQATTLAAGCLLAISRARLGPDTTTTCDPRARRGPPRAMTSLIRFVVPSSTPFIRLTRPRRPEGICVAH
jgi:hypothetical protein